MSTTILGVNEFTGQPITQAQGYAPGISDCDLSMYSDMFKDAYGIRMMPPQHITLSEFRARIEALGEEIAEQITEQEEAEDWAANCPYWDESHDSDEDEPYSFLCGG